MKYLKKFNTTTEYDQFKSGSDYVLPNVSYVVENAVVKFNPKQKNIIKCTYNVVANKSVRLCRTTDASPHSFSNMSVDGVPLNINSIDLNNYVFETSGLHIVEFELQDSEIKSFNGCSDLINIEIPEGVTSICDSCFGGSGITSILLPSSINNIGSYAFNYCQNLSSDVIIPRNVTTIKNGLFSSSTKCNVILHDDITYIGDNAFSGTSSLTLVSLPSKLEYVGNQAFKSIKGFKDNICIIPNSVTTIGEEAFYRCAIKKLTLGTSIASIGKNAFRDNIINEVTCYAITPPSTNYMAFYGLEKNGIVRYPEGSDYSTWNMLSASNTYGFVYNGWTIETF